MVLKRIIWPLCILLVECSPLTLSNLFFALKNKTKQKKNREKERLKVREEQIKGKKKTGESKTVRERKPVAVLVLANFQKQQKNHKAQSWLCLPQRSPPSPRPSPLPPQGQNNTIKCPISPF